MSSSVPRSQRENRSPRRSIDDFDDQERAAIEAAKVNFGSPVVVFGSRAKGNWADDSDIDIGVIGYNARHHKPLKLRISEFCRIKVDLFKIEHARTHSGAIEV